MLTALAVALALPFFLAAFVLVVVYLAGKAGP